MELTQFFKEQTMKFVSKALVAKMTTPLKAIEAKLCEKGFVINEVEFWHKLLLAIDERVKSNENDAVVLKPFLERLKFILVDSGQYRDISLSMQAVSILMSALQPAPMMVPAGYALVPQNGSVPYGAMVPAGARVPVAPPKKISLTKPKTMQIVVNGTGDRKVGLSNGSSSLPLPP